MNISIPSEYHNSNRSITFKHYLRPILQRLPGMLLIAVFLLAAYGPKYTPYLFVFYLAFLHIIFIGNNFRAAFAAYTTFISSKSSTFTNWRSKYLEIPSSQRDNVDFDSVIHCIILPNFRENLGTLRETLNVLASHYSASTNYWVLYYLS